MSARPRSSSDSYDSGRQSPIHGDDSSAALILVPDAEEHDAAPFDFSSDDDEAEEFDQQNDQTASFRSSSPPLSSTAVFLYLLSPFLKLGALVSVDDDGSLPLKLALPALFLFALLSGLTRQMWYMLARYVRRTDMEEIVLEALVRGKGRDRLRGAIRAFVRVSTGLLRVLLATVYLRVAVDVLLPFLPPQLLFSSRVTVTAVIALVLSPFCFAQSLAVTRVLYVSWVSVATFAAWLVCIAYGRAKGTLTGEDLPQSLGSLWQGITPMAFAFTTYATIPLYTSLKGTIQPGTPKPKRSQSFKLLSAMSVALGALLLLPLRFFHPASEPHVSSVSLQPLVACLNASTLVLSIPSIIVTAPPVPIPVFIRRRTNFAISKALVYIISICLCLLPQPASRVLSDALLVLAFASTFVVPAVIHITVHNFRRPLSIIIPPSTPATPTPTGRTAVPPSESRHDELLQRKERTLQRRRLGRRIMWDVAAWVLLLPVGGGGLVWAAGKVAGGW